MTNYLSKDNLWRLDAAFHNKWLNFIKKSTGASFVAYERQGDDYTIKVKNVGGNTYFIDVPNINEITAEDYKEMAWKINSEQNTTSLETQDS